MADGFSDDVSIVDTESFTVTRSGRTGEIPHAIPIDDH